MAFAAHAWYSFIVSRLNRNVFKAFEVIQSAFMKGSAAKILIPISNSFFVRNFLRGGFLSLFEFTGISFVFAVPNEKLEYYKQEFTDPRVRFVATPEVARPRLEKLFKEIEVSSIPTHTVRMMHWFYFLRKGTKQWFPIRAVIFCLRMMLWFAGHVPLWRSFVRSLYRIFRDKEHALFIAQESPDIVFAPTMIYGSEWIFLKEALRKGVRTVGMTSSWDNLYAKTFVRVKLDALLVQTEIMKRTARRYSGIPASSIYVTGVPQYDRYFNAPPLMSRENFMKSIGADPSKKLVVYAFSGKSTAELDMAVVRKLSSYIRDGGFGGAELLLRPYPKRDMSQEKVDALIEELGIRALPSAAKVGEGKNAWEFDEKALSLLTNTLAHADVVVTACSTFLVEAAVFGKPEISIGFDMEPGLNYWNSARRFFDWDHLRDLSPLKGVYIARSFDDLVSAVSDYILHPEHDASGRKAIVREQCVFTDGRSVERVAELIRGPAGLLSGGI